MENFNFNVTNSAFRRLVQLAKNQNYTTAYLLISVEGGGCSGFSYNYEFKNEASLQKNDFIISHTKSPITISVVIDDVSKQFLNNSGLDFIETLGESSFEIKNPNAKVKCGCGNSFGI